MMDMVRERWISLVIGSTSTLLLCAQPTWRRTYGALDDEKAQAVRRVNENEILVAGTSGSFGAGSSDIYLLKVDDLGEWQWSRTIGGPGVEKLSEMRLGSDGAIWMAGYTNSLGAGGYDGQLTKLGADGEVLLQRELGGGDWDFFHDLRIMPDGGLLVAGETHSFEHPSGSAWLVRYNSLGDTLWMKVLDVGPGSKALSVALTSDGGAIVSGSIPSSAGDLDAFLCKTDELGGIQWTSQYGGTGDDVAMDVLQCEDGGFSFMGSTSSFSQWTEAYHVRTDAGGSTIWTRNWGQINDQEAREHVQLSDGGFISLGYTKTSGGGGRDMFLLRSASDGDFVFGRTFGGVNEDEGYSVEVLPDGFLCAGFSLSYGAGGSDIFIVRTALDGTTATETVTSSFDALSVMQYGVAIPELFPNPSTGIIHFDPTSALRVLSVRDPSGRSVMEVRIPAGQQEVTLDLPEGIYFIAFGNSPSSRLIIQRP